MDLTSKLALVSKYCLQPVILPCIMHIVNQSTHNSGTPAVVTAKFSQDPDATAIVWWQKGEYNNFEIANILRAFYLVQAHSPFLSCQYSSTYWSNSQWKGFG